MGTPIIGRRASLLLNTYVHCCGQEAERATPRHLHIHTPRRCDANCSDGADVHGLEHYTQVVAQHGGAVKRGEP